MQARCTVGSASDIKKILMGKDQLILTSLTSVRFNLVVKNTNANLEYGIKLF